MHLEWVCQREVALGAETHDEESMNVFNVKWGKVQRRDEGREEKGIQDIV